MPSPGTAEAPPPGPPAQPLLLSGGALYGGQVRDVLMDQGLVAAVGVHIDREPSPGAWALASLEGWCVLPAAAEPHAHLDKVFLAGRAPDSGGDVRRAIRAVRDVYVSMTVEDILARARAATALALRRGFTAVRTHVDVGGDVGTRGVEALTLLREELTDLMDLQLVALPVQPVSGAGGAEGRRWLADALAKGADIVGGAPWLDSDPLRAVQELTAVAAGEGRPLDLHMDETTDVDVLTLGHLVRRVEELGLGGRTAASHCVSLGQQGPVPARALAGRMAAAGVAVIVLPQTNLYLQGRGTVSRVPRGLPPLGLLAQAGVLVAGGGDNWRDPFNPLGRVDPFETASLLVAAGHVSPATAYRMVSEDARAVMGLPSAAVHLGDLGDALAVRASGVDEAVAGAPEDRVVVHRARVVARSHLQVSGVLWDR